MNDSDNDNEIIDLDSDGGWKKVVVKVTLCEVGIPPAERSAQLSQVSQPQCHLPMSPVTAVDTHTNARVTSPVCRHTRHCTVFM